VAVLLLVAVGPASAQDPVAPDEEPTAPLVQGVGPPEAQAPASGGDGLEQARLAHRSTTAAILMSVPLPGWGQLYADSPFWGVVAFGAQMWFYGNIALELRRHERQRVARDAEAEGSALRERRDALITEHSERVRDFVWWAAGSLLLVSLDAYVSVQLVDFDAPEPPTPDLDRQWTLAPPRGGVVALALSLPF
jgi:hypothetical protein